MNSLTAAGAHRAAAATALETVPCRCGPEYYERALAAPDCYHHDLADEMAPWLHCPVCWLREVGRSGKPALRLWGRAVTA